jgi:hypothetical protein
MFPSRCKLAALVLLLAPVTAAFGAPEDKKGPRFDLVLNKEQYEVGEPIVATVRLTNTGDAPLEVWVSNEKTGQLDGWSFTIRNEKKEPVPDPGNEFRRPLSCLGSSVPVEPGKTYTRELLLNYRVGPLGPGKYTVQGLYQVRAGLGRTTIADSPVVSFRIADTAPAAVQKRVAMLAKELRDGKDALQVAPLLGFTGHPDAIAPLIDLLYAKTDQAEAAAADALLYLDQDKVTRALLEAAKKRGPRYRLVYLLVVEMRADGEEVLSLLGEWLGDPDSRTRYAAVEGIRLADKGKSPQLLSKLECRIDDPDRAVRVAVVSTIGGYQNAAALKPLKIALRDTDPNVAEQAAIAVGWVAQAAKPDSAARRDAITLLHEAQKLGGRVAEQATEWLRKVENE